MVLGIRFERIIFCERAFRRARPPWMKDWSACFFFILFIGDRRSAQGEDFCTASCANYSLRLARAPLDLCRNEGGEEDFTRKSKASVQTPTVATAQAFGHPKRSNLAQHENDIYIYIYVYIMYMYVRMYV